MPKACSLDLRERVIEAVEGGASRREAVERFEVSASSAVKWWLQSWRREGRRAPRPRGGSRSPLEAMKVRPAVKYARRHNLSGESHAAGSCAPLQRLAPKPRRAPALSGDRRFRGISLHGTQGALA
jgi:transposase